MDTLRAKFLRHIGQTSPSPLLIEVARAEGVYFYTPEGKPYFDLIAGVTVNNVGHNNPAVIEAVQKQVSEYMHVMVYGEMIEKPQVALAEKITSLLPDSLDSVYFLSSGSEAVEGALKLAKRFTGRTEIISFRNSYHGSTHGSLSVMGAETYKNAFRPLLPDTRILDFNSPEQLEQITSRTAAVIMEPVQSEAGVRLSRKGFLQKVRAACDRAGAMLIFDEIQTGLGRSGTMFGFEKYGVIPDILCLAKALGGGMPLGAFISSRKKMNTLTHDPVLGHITTFGGHPVCCAAGLAALCYTVENNLSQNGEEMGELYERLLENHPAVREIRRSGLMMAVELGCADKMFAVMKTFVETGILSDWFLFCDTAFRISPPLTITEDEVRESVKLIVRALDKLL